MIGPGGRGARPAPASGRLRLVVVKGASAGLEWEGTPREVLTIGRGAQNVLRVSPEDKTVSRQHAAIHVEGEGYRLLRQKPEAFVMCAGEPIPDDGVLLADGDEVQLGLVVLRVQIGSPAWSDPDLTVVDPRPTRDAIPPPSEVPPVQSGETPVPRLDAEAPPEPAVGPDEPALPAVPASDEPPARVGDVPSIAAGAPPASSTVRPASRAGADAPPRPAARTAASPPPRRPAPEPLGRFGAFDVLDALDGRAGRTLLAADQAGELVLRRLGGVHLGFFARRRFFRACRGHGPREAEEHLLRPVRAGREGGELWLAWPGARGATAGALLRAAARDLTDGVAAAVVRDAARGVAVLESADAGMRAAVGEHEVLLVGSAGRAIVLHVPLPPALVVDERYVAPEEDAGQAGDPRAAVFSLGILLYELLAREPVEAARKAVLRRVDTVRIRVPVALADVAARATEVRPEQRFSGAAALADALDDALRALPGTSPGDVAAWMARNVPDPGGSS